MAGFYEQRDRDGNLIGWQAKVRKKGYPTQTQVFRSKREAQDWSAIIESEMVRGTFAPRTEADRTTLGECFERYLAEVTPGKKVKAGCGEYSFIASWLKRPLSKRSMSDIRGVDVAKVIRDMEAEGKSPNTIRLHMAALSNLFAVAKSNWGMTSLDNPVTGVRKPRLPGGRERRLLTGEMGALLGAVDLNMACLIALALETAMRRGEIVSLTWSKVDIKNRSLFLPKTKNGDARTVPLSPAAIIALEIALENAPNKKNGSVFGLSDDAVDSAWDRARIAAGIPSGWGADALHFHDLRHEATSRFFERTDLDIMEIRAITGHRNLQMLARYTHLRTANLADRLAGGKRGGGY
ncbi:site-specific integrase [Acidithiobacillus sp. MC6.1]|nr:site-specific integrase [Acidithiobacillus sp. MC6.1]